MAREQTILLLSESALRGVGVFIVVTLIAKVFESLRRNESERTERGETFHNLASQIIQNAAIRPLSPPTRRQVSTDNRPELLIERSVQSLADLETRALLLLQEPQVDVDSATNQCAITLEATRQSIREVMYPSLDNVQASRPEIQGA